MQSLILLSYFSHIGANILSGHKLDATCFEIILVQAKIQNLDPKDCTVLITIISLNSHLI